MHALATQFVEPDATSDRAHKLVRFARAGYKFGAMKHLLATATLGAIFLISCNKEEGTATVDDAAKADAPAADAGDAGGTETAEPAAAEEKKVWADMNFDERKMHMGTVVWPQMKEKFQAYDAEQFADFKCQTCHGDDMTEVKFEMPNSLTPLPVENTFQAAMDMDAEMAKFMGEVVVPEMAKQLDMEAGPGEGQIGCFSCHLKDE